MSPASMFPVLSRAAVTAGAFALAVSVSPLAAATSTANIPVAASPDGVVFAPDGTRAYVNSNTSGPGAVSVIDTAARKTVATVRTGRGTWHHEISPDGRRVYAGNYHDGTVSVIDTTANRVTATIRAGVQRSAPWPSLVPGGRKLYVAVGNGSNAEGSVQVVDTATNRITGAIRIGKRRPDVKGFSRDGRQAYLSGPDGRTLHTVDTATDRVTRSIRVTDAQDRRDVLDFELSPDGRRAYLNDRSLSGNGETALTVVDLAAGKVLSRTLVKDLWSMKLTRDGRWLYATKYDRNPDSPQTLVVIEAATSRVVFTDPASAGQGIFGADGRFMYTLGRDNAVQVFDTLVRRVVQEISVKGKNSGHLAFTPNDRQLYVVNEGSDDVTVIDLAG